MSEQKKWRVEKRDQWIYGEYWTAFQGESRFFSPQFATHAEALAHADRMARTVTVTLPRLDPEGWTTVGGFRVAPEPFDWGDALEVDELDDDSAYFILGQEDCEPLALALLAHARKSTH